MSFGTAKSDSGSISQIDPKLYADWQKLRDESLKVAEQSAYSPYGGQRVATDNPFEDLAQYRTLQAADMGQGQIGQAANVFNGVATDSPTWMDAQQASAQGYNPATGQAAQVGDIIDIHPALSGVERATSGTIPDAGYGRYLNTFQDAVLRQSNDELDRQRQIAQNQNAAAASAAGAFGGSRHGIVDAENNRNFAQLKAENTNTLLQGGYDRAMGLLSQDLDRSANTSLANAQFGNTVAGQNADRMNAAQQYNSQADYQARLGDTQMRQQMGLANLDAQNTAGQFGAAAQNAMSQFNAQQRQQNQQDYGARDLQQSALNLQGAQGLLGAANQQQQQYLAGANALAASGAAQRTIDQSNLDAAYEEYLRRIADPQQRLNILGQPFGLIPSNQQSTSSGSSKSVSGAVKQ